MQLEFEISHDAEISATTTQAPVQLRILIGISMEKPAIGRDDIEAKDIVEREAELPPDPAESAA